MAGALQRFAKRFFITCTIVLVIVYLLTCFIPYLNAGKYWPIAVLGLGFPLMLVLLITFIFIWAIVRSKWAFLPLIALIVSWQQISVFFAFGKPSAENNSRHENSLRVLNWNVSSWDEANKHKNGGQSHRKAMLALIKSQDADILCLQEFFEFETSNFYEPNIPAVKAMGYPYYYFVPHYFRYRGAYRMGVAIFSKHPITDTAVVPYKQNSAADNLVYADISVGGKIIRLMTTHLQSVRFNPVDYEGINNIANTDDNALEASKTILSKIIRAYRSRSGQAEQVREEIDKSPHPVIICGDFNDVPNSYTYFTIRGDLTDAFIAKGAGIGKTLRILGPTLRIDYILADKTLSISRFNKFNVPYSDHYPIMADILLK
ncbi:MAG: endonuclease/exonuclease/phosphatase family protein [Chitinophagaceae bacterium]|nr:endonuclease/exonuclease/phosphatase family protein [Chitinophagaceae bacterium]